VALVCHIGTDAGAALVKNDFGAPTERRDDLSQILKNGLARGG
jgi:hypothetical protein